MMFAYCWCMHLGSEPHQMSEYMETLPLIELMLWLVAVGHSRTQLSLQLHSIVGNPFHPVHMGLSDASTHHHWPCLARADIGGSCPQGVASRAGSCRLTAGAGEKTLHWAGCSAQALLTKVQLPHISQAFQASCIAITSPCPQNRLARKWLIAALPCDIEKASPDLPTWWYQ